MWKFITLLLLNSFSVMYGQYSLCECCTYGFQSFGPNFQDFFPPNAIKNSGISEVTIYSKYGEIQVHGQIVRVSNEHPEYPEMRLKFNQAGYVISRVDYYNGRYNSILEFNRDKKNRLITQSFYYLDSLGQKTDNNPDLTWKYFYKGTKMVKQKQIQGKYQKLPDSLGHYIVYQYDKEGRMIMLVRHDYYEKDAVYHYESLSKYSSSDHTSLITTFEKDTIRWYQKNILNDSGEIINEKFYDNRDSSLLQECIREYDLKSRLIKYEIINTGMGTECPPNYFDCYDYDSRNLLIEIKHVFETYNMCRMRFEYK